MSFPSGLPTKTVTFGHAVTMEAADPMGMRVRIKANRTLVHRPSGQVLLSIEKTYANPGGTETQILLPICDSPDMGYGDGSSIDVTDGKVTHTYVATVEYFEPGNLSAPRAELTRTVGPFVLLASDPETIDLDDLEYLTPIVGDPIQGPGGGGDLGTHTTGSGTKHTAEHVSTTAISSGGSTLPSGNVMTALTSIWTNLISANNNLATHTNASGSKHSSDNISVPAGTISGASTVTAAFTALKTSVQTAVDNAAAALTDITNHKSAASNAHAASTISTTGLPAATVQAVLADLNTRLGTVETTGGGGGGGAANAAALAFTPTGAISATNVQAAIAEVASEAAATDVALVSSLSGKLDKTGTLASVSSGPLFRRDLNYTMATTQPNLFEFAVNGSVRSWLNEWGALRGRNPYPTFNDALVRAIIEPGDSIQTGGNAVEIVDRRLPDGAARQVWGRRWSDGRLVRNGNLMTDVYWHLDPEEPLPDNLPVPCLVIVPGISVVD